MTARQHHSSGEPRPAHAAMPARGWMVFGGSAVVVTVVIVGVLVASGAPLTPKASSPGTASAPASLPDLGGPRSRLVPEMTLPPGARPYTGKQPTPPGFEFWEVPGSHHDLVALMRSELPVFGSLNGMPWCGEVSDSITSWAWGTAADTIGVSLIDGGVMVRRFPEPHGCHP